jgi:hypothetical protein
VMLLLLLHQRRRCGDVRHSCKKMGIYRRQHRQHRQHRR